MSATRSLLLFTFALSFSKLIHKKIKVGILSCWVNHYFLNAGSCDFEQKSFCTWLNVPNANRSVGLDDFDWTLGSGSTPSWQTGPSTDHTTGTAVGKFEKESTDVGSAKMSLCGCYLL